MPNNNAVIPLYINENLLNNLFTVVVQQFVEIKTISTRSQQAIKISTPLSNVMKGCFIQGTFNLELLEEFSKQRTEERISKIIIVFLETKQILEQQNLLKGINSEQDLSNIEENDYIEFKCMLNKSPQMEQVEDIIRYMEMKNIFYPKDQKDYSNVLSLLKNQYEDWKKSSCLKFITSPLADSNAKAIVPIQLKYMQDNIEHLYNNNVTVLGKVVKKKREDNNEYINLSSGTYYDFLNEEDFNQFCDSFLQDAPFKQPLKGARAQEDSYLMEVIPIAMYI